MFILFFLVKDNILKEIGGMLKKKIEDNIWFF